MRFLAAALLLAAAPSAADDFSSARPGLIRMGGILLFYHSDAPLSFKPATRGELPAGAVDMGRVKGRACQHGLSIPLTASLRATNVSGAAGKGGFEKSISKIRENHPDLAGLFDVKVDLHILTILGLYKRTCSEINARGFRKGP